MGVTEVSLDVRKDPRSNTRLSSNPSSGLTSHRTAVEGEMVPSILSRTVVISKIASPMHLRNEGIGGEGEMKVIMVIVVDGNNRKAMPTARKGITFKDRIITLNREGVAMIRDVMPIPVMVNADMEGAVAAINTDSNNYRKTGCL